MKKEELLRLEEEEHRKFHRRILYVSLIMMIVLFGGATFYYYMEGWRYLDALYFSSYTITTVGYGDITPKTDLGKIFTIFYIFVGVGIVLYGLSLMASHFVEVREEYWLEKIQGIRIRHPRTIWEKFKRFLSFSSEELVNEYKNNNYEKPSRKK